MNALVRRFLRLLASRGQAPAVAAGGIVEALVQTFENWRPGLPDHSTLSSAQDFFLNLYAKEAVRLQESIRLQLSHLSPARRRQYFVDLDEYVRQVLLPAYLRYAVHFTDGERRRFYHVIDRLRAVERVFWGLAGTALGAFVIWAPFIPLWSRGWVVPFVLLGFFFPDIRRYLAIRAYEEDLNELVAKTDRELQRIEMSYLTAADDAGDQDGQRISIETAGNSPATARPASTTGETS